MHLFSDHTPPSPNQDIYHPILQKTGISITIKREDQLHHMVSGNKFRKLKYNFLEAKKAGHTKVLTFGGAYSNHIAATAATGKLMGLQTIGVIRGEELAKDLEHTYQTNTTLRYAAAQGMHLMFVSRSEYKEKTTAIFLAQLQETFGTYYLIPEGGTNALAIKGCEEILTTEDKAYDVITCAVGTGGTIAGLIQSASAKQHIMGFPALKGSFLKKEIEHYTSKKNWELIEAYHFGGYSKVTPELVDFINTFKKEQKIALDPIYTGKMLFGLFDRIEKGYVKKNTRILAIHTGGLQGITGINNRLEKKKLPLII